MDLTEGTTSGGDPVPTVLDNALAQGLIRAEAPAAPRKTTGKGKGKPKFAYGVQPLKLVHPGRGGARGSVG